MRTLAGLRVLVVEDEPFIATDVEASLRSFGCEVIGPFGNAEAAVAAIRTEKPGAAMLDINQHGHHSFEVADALALLEIPFVFLSGHSEHIVPSRHRGRPFVAKPYLVHTLRAALEELMLR